jgi:hypothetical protein
MFVAQYKAWDAVRKNVAEKEAEIERISKPDKCPVVVVYDWDRSYIGTHFEEANSREQEKMLKEVKSAGDLAVQFDNYGFYLQSEGETAYEITLEEFQVEPGVTVTGKTVPRIVGQRTGQSFMAVWIKERNHLTDQTKWNLREAFRQASDNRHGKMIVRPDYSCTLRLKYRDHNDFWYRTTQQMAYILARRDFEFGPIKFEKLGLNRNTLSA